MELLIFIAIVILGVIVTVGGVDTIGRWVEALVGFLGTTPFWIGFVIVIVLVLALSWPWWIRELKELRSRAQAHRCRDAWHSNKRSEDSEQECPTCGTTGKRLCYNTWHQQLQSISEPECPACGEDWKGELLDVGGGTG